MTTGAIIAIVIVALIIIAVVAFLLPRMRRKAQLEKRERELQQRRDRVADEHRAEADARERHAEEAEQRARIAQREAEAERAQAQLHQERAGLHEKGMADDELIADNERDKFAGTSAMSRDQDGDGRPDGDTRHDRDGDGVDDRREAITGDGRDDSQGGTLDNEYDRGRRDQAVKDEHNRPARFAREDGTTEAAPAADQRDAPTRY
jgi:hypothetical protein